MSWDRFEKLASLIKQRITTIILYKLKDPRIGFVTVTKVDLARDLKTCTVYYSVLGTQADQSRTQNALQDARGFIQGEIGKTLSTRTIPRVQFRLDESLAKADRIFQILKEVRREADDAGSEASEIAGSEASEIAGSGASEDAEGGASESAGGEASEDAGSGASESAASGAGAGEPDESGAGGAAGADSDEGIRDDDAAR